MLRSNPHLIEINTRIWLKQLKEKYSLDEMTLSTVPEEEWEKLKHLGFDIVWLMGIWAPSQESARLARSNEALIGEISKAMPSLDKSAVSASPYAVFEYKLNPELGFEWELRSLKDKLNSMGMKLLVDFVSNHTARDNPLIGEFPDCYITGSEEDFKSHPDWFFETEINGSKKYVAYGRDPNFPPWTDTAQLNYFNQLTREKMLNTLVDIAEVADGVRCDMVMLTLNDIHEGAWGQILGRAGFRRPSEEFWERAISKVKEKHPEFIFLAEVYWGLEWRVQTMGFDYTYDKVTYDRLRYLGAEDIRGHLRAEKLYQKRSVRFIDNHDEEPSIKVFGRDRAAAASVVISTIKGLRFFYDPQLDGASVRLPLQLNAYCPVNVDAGIRKFYEKLMKIVSHPAFHGGEWNLLEIFQCEPQNSTNKNILAWSWVQRRTIKIVVVNYSSEVSCGIVNISIRNSGETTAVFEELSDRFFSFSASDLASGLKMQKMAPWAAYIFDIEF